LVALMRRGEVWVANLNPTRGQEVGKVRPVLIVQSDALHAGISPTVICLPLTSQVRPAFSRWRVSLPARERLLRPCQVITDQPRSIDRSRFGEGPLTTLTGDELAAVERGLRAAMELLGD
jgi:mRNA interferase MazF